MALDKSTLIKTLTEIFKDNDPTKTPKEAATAIANAIDTYVKTATVTITALAGDISVQGSPSAQKNAEPLTLKGGDSTHSGGLS